MGNTKGVVFTDEQDEVLREVYPSPGGGKAARAAVNERFGTSFRMDQVHSRCRTLGLQSGFGSNKRRPPAHWPDCAETKPTIACWDILEYIGYKRRNGANKCHHNYRVRCRPCGTEYIRIQESIAQAASKKTAGCPKCAAQKQVVDRRANDSEAAYMEAQVRQIWIDAHQAIRPLSPVFWTDDHRNRHPHL